MAGPHGYRETRAWEPVQTAAFLEFVTDASERLTALFEAAYTGLRRGELFALRWSDLDADSRGLRVRHNLVEVARERIPAEQRRCVLCGREHVGRVLKGPKSRAGRRWVPLAAPAQTALRAQRARQDVERRRAYRDHDLVFAAPDGDPLRPSLVSAEFSRLARAYRLPQIRLHDLRHSACSLLLAGGVPLEVVQMILGHAAPSVTRRVYAHILRDPTAAQVNEATDLLTRHRSSRPPSPGSTGSVSNGEQPRARCEQDPQVGCTGR